MDEPVLPSESKKPIKLVMKINPYDNPDYIKLNEIQTWLDKTTGKNQSIITHMEISCDQCQKSYPYFLAGTNTARHKCKYCEHYYDLCMSCLGNIETCPLCHEVDHWW